MKACIAFVLICGVAFAGGDEGTTPLDPRFKTAWQEFYYGGHSELDVGSSLIRVGKPIVPSVCRAIEDKNMRRRRYAIDALGWIGDEKAIPTLKRIVLSEDEIEYFRADALEALYRINPQFAHQLALPYKDRTDLFGKVANAVLSDDKTWFKPSDES